MRRFSVLFLTVLTACGSPTPGLRHKAETLAAGVQMRPVETQAGDFTLQLYERVTDNAAPVRVYIEGDGNAWLTASQISPDPTPFDPVALKLALRDNSPNVVYMARPCQYIPSNACQPGVWTYAQFSDSIIAGIVQAMNRWPGHKLELVGYSGGGAVAVLTAARRDDVVSIRTVAGNLDTDAFTTLHHVSPLSSSLNPALVAGRVARIPQRHFVGDKDKVVPVAITQSYQSRMAAGHCSAYDSVSGVDHYSGWPEAWPGLLVKPLPCQ